jgi:hypothetical protein
MGKFFGWLGGVLAAIIAGYAVWYLTQPMRIEGMVINRVENVAIEKALVTVEVNGAPSEGPFNDPTDSNGSYGMALSGISWRTTVTVRAKASGFQDSGPVSLVIGPGENHKDLYLTPIVTSQPGINPPSTHPAMVHPPPSFVKKAIIPNFAIQKKP